jgi:hypothetical protein
MIVRHSASVSFITAPSLAYAQQQAPRFVIAAFVNLR